MPRMSYARFRAEFRRYDFQRRPEWGWQLALHFARKGHRPYKKYDGYWPCEATRLVRALGLTGDEFDFVLDRRHRRRWHAIREAHTIWRENRIHRWTIEARVLARQTDAEIASIEGLPTDTIEAYSQLFFDVRCKLRVRHYIDTHVLHLRRRCTGADVGRVWAFFAFNANTVVLQALIDDFLASGKPDYAHLDTGWFSNFGPECKNRWMYWSIQDRMLEPVLSQEQAMKLIELSVRMQEAQALGNHSSFVIEEPPVFTVPTAEDLAGIIAVTSVA